MGHGLLLLLLLPTEQPSDFQQAKYLGLGKPKSGNTEDIITVSSVNAGSRWGKDDHLSQIVKTT